MCSTEGLGSLLLRGGPFSDCMRLFPPSYTCMAKEQAPDCKSSELDLVLSSSTTRTDVPAHHDDFFPRGIPLLSYVGVSFLKCPSLFFPMLCEVLRDPESRLSPAFSRS